MNISNFNKAEVLAALYNRAKPQGMGFLQYTPGLMTTQDAQQILDNGNTYFDYHNGRVMKIDLSSNEMRTGLYNRDNGENAAENAIAAIQTETEFKIRSQKIHAENETEI